MNLSLSSGVPRELAALPVCFERRAWRPADAFLLARGHDVTDQRLAFAGIPAPCSPEMQRARDLIQAARALEDFPTGHWDDNLELWPLRAPQAAALQLTGARPAFHLGLSAARPGTLTLLPPHLTPDAVKWRAQEQFEGAGALETLMHSHLGRVFGWMRAAGAARWQLELGQARLLTVLHRRSALSGPEGEEALEAAEGVLAQISGLRWPRMPRGGVSDLAEARFHSAVVRTLAAMLDQGHPQAG